MFGDLLSSLGNKLNVENILQTAINFVPGGAGQGIADTALKFVSKGETASAFMDMLENMVETLPIKSDMYGRGSVMESMPKNERLNFLKNHAFWKELRKRSGDTKQIEQYGTQLLGHLKFLK